MQFLVSFSLHILYIKRMQTRGKIKSTAKTFKSISTQTLVEQEFKTESASVFMQRFLDALEDMSADYQ